jgi:hypothetical protein
MPDDPSAEPVVYLLQSRIGKRGKRTKKDHWHTEGAFLTHLEAECAGLEREHLFWNGWRVYGVLAAGKLAKRLAEAER